MIDQAAARLAKTNTLREMNYLAHLDLREADPGEELQRLDAVFLVLRHPDDEILEVPCRGGGGGELVDEPFEECVARLACLGEV